MLSSGYWYGTFAHSICAELLNHVFWEITFAGLYLVLSTGYWYDALDQGINAELLIRVFWRGSLGDDVLYFVLSTHYWFVVLARGILDPYIFVWFSV